MKKLKYLQHQRDYTILGTSAVFHSFNDQVTRSYFSYDPDPMYILVRDNILYHFTSVHDAQTRVTNWIKKYDFKNLKKHKANHDSLLKDYLAFLRQKHKSPLQSLQKLHTYFTLLLPIILVGIEVPEHAPKLQNEIQLMCSEIRKANEAVYKLGIDLQTRLVNQLEKMKKISKNSLTLLTYDEFQKFITNKNLPKNLIDRKRFVFIEETRAHSKISYDKIFPKKIKLVGSYDQSLNFVTGKTAYPGKVSAQVRIIKRVSDASNLKKGEILVTSMTDPRYVSAIKRASAIITDEGGITCHAAIVSREFKKPCVIGTQIATKVFKNGDLVEVDANKGSVKKI